jgi:hypothetical protein
MDASDDEYCRKKADSTNQLRPVPQKPIVMDTERGTLTFHWHHADEPSDPIHFAWPRKYRAKGTHGVV